jgi:uncharacterized membrane protein
MGSRPGPWAPPFARRRASQLLPPVSPPSVPELASCKAESAVAAAAAGDFGLTANDMQALAQKLHPNESAIVILFENVWERRFRDAAKARGGEVLNQRLISSKGLVEAAVRLARE